MSERQSRTFLFTALALAGLGLGLASAPALADGASLSQDVIVQLPGPSKIRSIERQIPLLVQPEDVPQTGNLADIVWAGCGVQVASGKKPIKNAKFQYSANVASISQFGQIISVVETSGNVKTNKQGYATWDIPIGAKVDEWLTGVFSVLFVDLQGKNNKKLDWFAARCRVNFVEPCVADDQTSCIGDGRFQVSLGNGWEVTSSNNLTAIFVNAGTQVEVDVLDACPEAYYVTADRTGGATNFNVEARDVWTGERAFVSGPDEAFLLSSCY
jgi:hypothetical protein